MSAAPDAKADSVLALIVGLIGQLVEGQRQIIEGQRATCDEIRALRLAVEATLTTVDAQTKASRADLLAALVVTEGRLAFSASAAYGRATQADGLLADLLRAMGISSSRSFGRTLAACEHDVIHGLELRRIGRDRHGSIWCFCDFDTRISHLEGLEASRRPA